MCAQLALARFSQQLTVMSEFLPYGRQQIDEDDIAAVVTALRQPLITQGPLVEQFEHAIAEYIGAEHVSVCNNGTAALWLAYAGLGIGPGDEIITSPITFAATAAAARWLGADVVFADVDPRTGNLDATTIERHISPRTRAIVAVHLAGLPADLRRLRAIADDHDLLLIEDAAHALGATAWGESIGGGACDASTFSFHPVKHLTTGEGGAVVVRDAEVKRRVDMLRHHGVERDPSRFVGPNPGPWYYEVQALGFNCRLTDVQCALGLSQLAKQPGWLQRRRDIAARYRAQLASHMSYALPQAERAHRVSAYHLFPVLIDFDALSLSRADVMATLRARGIGTQVHYIPLTEHPYYDCGPTPPGARRYYEQTLSLPMFPGMTDRDVDYVVGTLASTLHSAKAA